MPFAHGQGSFAEVLDGDLGTPAGVCPDQAWSAAMLVSPVIEGMLGARPDALARRLTLAPHLPSGWRDCEWRGLHVGHTTLDVRVSALPDRVLLRVRRTAGAHLELTVAPALPPGRRMTDALVDDERLVPRVAESMGCLHAAVSFELADEHDVEIWHAKA